MKSHLTALTALVVSFAPLPAMADLERITDRGAFLSAVEGRELSRLGVSLRVSPNGTIAGRALGRDVTGTWSWENGMFCRTLDAGDRQFGRNCQVVSVDGGNIRFHADQGTGDIADFRIR
ncbi:dihydrodipicolinate reductase [Hasllibacter sp. MH4015]|uniref:dihydrodipicolinate reductase n=1 Tax=Hasllibacter sp. MH4015 TaxID=2854029 RepID=UPI001CD67BB4|nr:dihydrodipicolinate reductase [Hasllibacter sp. MH4015]